MEIYIRRYEGGVVKFDTESGDVEDREYGTADQTHWGFVWKQGGKWFAIRIAERYLVFQHKKHVWPLQKPYSFKLVDAGFLRHFVICNGSTKAFGLWYKPKDLLCAAFDPTYDDIDAMDDDFFMYAWNMWTSWSDKDLEDFDDPFWKKAKAGDRK